MCEKEFLIVALSVDVLYMLIGVKKKTTPKHDRFKAILKALRLISYASL